MLAVCLVAAVCFGVAVCVVLATFIALGVGFDEAGEINECIGCPRDDDAYCEGCKLNPKYWVGRKYAGPERKELRRIRKKWERK